jgi:pilus assembly protein FimV
MNNNSMPLAIAIAVAFLGSAPHAAAAALGEVTALSAMGESFRAEIRLPGGKPADAECFRVVPASGGEFPSLRQGRVAVTGIGADARLVVRDSARVGEPVLTMVIENVCESRLRREYTLLMPFAQSARLPAAASPPAARAPAARTPRPAAPSQPKPAAKSRTRTLSTTGDESLVTLAASLYPDDPAAQARFTEATAAANPKLFSDASALTRILPAGTALRMPDLRPRPDLSSPPAPETSPQSLAAAQGTDRLVVDKSVGSRSAGVSAPPATGDGGPRSHAERERALAAAIDRSIIAEMELLARIKELEEIQASLKERVLGMQAAPTAPAAPAVAVPIPPPPPPRPEPVLVADPAPAPTREGTDEWGRDAYLFGGLGLAALAIVALLRRSRRPAHSGASGLPVATATATTLGTAESRKGRARAEETGFGFGIGTVDTRLEWPAGTETTIIEEHKSAVELADIMMSFGRVRARPRRSPSSSAAIRARRSRPGSSCSRSIAPPGLRDEFNAIAGSSTRPSTSPRSTGRATTRCARRR